MSDTPTTPPAPRSNVLAIPAYVPGRPPTARPGLTSYKLSSNENPFGPLPGVLAAAEEAVAHLNRYPDMGSAALYDALGAHLDVPTDRLAVATGSVGLLYQLVAAYCEVGDEVVHAWRSFEAYPIALAASGAVGRAVPLLPDGRHDLDAMVAAIGERTRVVVVCTPNNPTGPAVTQTELDGFLARVPRDVVVVVDEAYVEFVRAADPIDGVATAARWANVVLTRTFSKAYGLAGLRVGYAVGHPETAAALRAVSLPFGVSAVAQAAAVASLAAHAAMVERVDELVVRRERLLAGLRAQGWPVPDAQGNFVWLPFPGDPDATRAFAAAADEAGVVVRPFPGDGVRISVGEDEACGRVLAVAGAVARGAGR